MQESVHLHGHRQPAIRVPFLLHLARLHPHIEKPRDRERRRPSVRSGGHLELLERGVPAGREVVGDRLARELVPRGVAGDVAREGALPDLVAAAAVFGDGVAEGERCGEEDWAYRTSRRRGEVENMGWSDG